MVAPSAHPDMMTRSPMNSAARLPWWTALCLVAALGLLGGAFFGRRQELAISPRAPGDEQVLRIVYTQKLPIDPHQRTFPLAVQNQFILALWEPLIECDPVTGQPQPAAAESWEWSPDRLTLTLKLRADGRWSNGERVTANDFVRAWQRLLKLDVELAAVLYPLKNAQAFNRGEVADPAKVGMEAIDELTLRLSLANVRSTLVTELADPLLVPLHASNEATLKAGTALSDPAKLVTNGAFVLTGASARGYRVAVSPTYRERKSIKLTGVEFLRADNAKVGRLLVASGQADLMSPVFGFEAAAFPTARPVTTATEMALTVTTLDLNTSHGPLRDERVRRALSLALPRAAALRKGKDDTMAPAYSWVPDMPGRPGLKLLHEDPEEARRLMAEAGYPNGEGFPVLRLPIPLAWREIDFIEAWTEAWHRELGVRTYLVREKGEMRVQHLQKGDYDIFYNGLVATVPDAGDMLGTFTMPGVYSASRWENPEVNRLMREADRKAGAERLALLERVERIVMDAVPTIPALFEQRRTLLATEIEGWYADPLGRQSLKRLAIRSPLVRNDTARDPL